jgi:glycolate oxidase subunit GlcD
MHTQDGPRLSVGPGLGRDLRRIVGAEHVMDPGFGGGRYCHDMTDRGGVTGRPDAIVMPGSADEVAALMRWAYAQDVPLIARGGGTGYAGGATPVGGGVIVSMERLDAIHQFDPLLWRIHVGAGVTTRTVQRLALENGLTFPVDPGAAEESQIGGNIATNVGGPHCFKYGTMRAWVTGVRAVLAPGEVASFGGAQRKDVAGYDILGLLVGSEGTLGLVTDAWLKLMPRPAYSAAVCAVFPDAASGGEAIESVLASGTVPAAIEYLDDIVTRTVRGTAPPGFPDADGFLVIVDVDSGEADRNAVVDALGPAAFAPDPRQLWRWRESVGHAMIALKGGKLSEDIAVPVDQLAEAVDETQAIGRRFGVLGCSWGHAGDGNLHSTFLFSAEDPDEAARAGLAAEAVLELAVRLGGTISGEHGVGVLKAGYLSKQWDTTAVLAHRTLKHAFDPKNLLNPGKKLA